MMVMVMAAVMVADGTSSLYYVIKCLYIIMVNSTKKPYHRTMLTIIITRIIMMMITELQ